MSTLYLHVPELDELWYRKKLLEDPETMSYNRGYDLDLTATTKKPAASLFRNRSGKILSNILWETSRNAFMPTL